MLSGDPTYLCPDEEERCPEFFVERTIAAVMVLKPGYISGSRERLRLVPADLDDTERLRYKVFGSHGDRIVSQWKYTAPKYYRRIGAVLFAGALSAKEVGQHLQFGEDRYEAQVAEQAERDRVRAYEKSFEDFIEWYVARRLRDSSVRVVMHVPFGPTLPCSHVGAHTRLRNTDEVHQHYLQLHVDSLCEGKSQVCRFHVDTIIESDGPVTIYQFEVFNFEEKGVLASLRQMYQDRGYHLFADAAESILTESETPHKLGAAARAALRVRWGKGGSVGSVLVHATHVLRVSQLA